MSEIKKFTIILCCLFCTALLSYLAFQIAYDAPQPIPSLVGSGIVLLIIWGYVGLLRIALK